MGPKGQPLYLVPIFLIPLASFVGNYLNADKPVIRGQSWSILLSYALLALALVLWIQYKPKEPWHSFQHAFFALLFGVWIIESVSTQLDQSVFNINAFLVIPSVLMVWAKRPSAQGMRRAYVLLLYGVIFISGVSLFFGALGWMPDGFQVGDSGPTRFPLVTEFFGITTRWGGPFLSVNDAAPIGGLLFIVGLTLQRPSSVVISVGGITILFLAQARTSMVAVAAAGIILIIFSRPIMQSSVRRLIQWSLVLTPIVLISLYILAFDPSLNGRTPIWRDFLSLSFVNPIRGVGTSGILDFATNQINDPSIGFAHTKAHSVLLDIASRHGLVLLLPTLAILGLVLYYSWRSRRLDEGKAFAITTYVIVAGFAETIFTWQYLTIYSLTLIYVVSNTPTKKSLPKVCH